MTLLGISHYKKYGRIDYGRIGLWTNRYMAELIYGRVVSKAPFYYLFIHSEYKINSIHLINISTNQIDSYILNDRSMEILSNALFVMHN